MSRMIVRALGLWGMSIVVITGVFGFAYVSVQESYRQSTNDPQIQLAEDAAQSLSRDYVPASVVSRSTTPVDIAISLAPWVTVYDASGTALESSATLDGIPPQLPKGLFDISTWSAHKTWEAPTGPETRVTWQPRPGVRQAVVLVQFQTPQGIGYVAAGRSMRLVEERLIGLTWLGAIAWIATVIATLFAAVIVVALGLL